MTSTLFSVRNNARALLLEVLAGLVVATIAVAYCVGFASVIFDGPIAAGLPTGLWSMLVGTAIASVILAFMTSLSPAVATQEAIAIGMMKFVSLSIVASSQSAGLSTEQTVTNVMAGLIIASIAGGAGLAIVGVVGVGQLLRFVPSPVTGGFLCATGVVVWDASLRMVTDGRPAAVLTRISTDPRALAEIATALCFFLTVLLLRLRIRSPLLLPFFFIGCSLAVVVAHRAGLLPGMLDGWFPQTARSMKPWYPLLPGVAASVDWGIIAENVAGIVAVPFVLIVSLVVRTAAFEASFNRSADFNTEFKAHGFAALASSVVGGTLAASAQGPVRLLHELKAKSAIPGLVAASVAALIVLAGVDLTAVFPVPILSGLLLLVGWVIIRTAIEQPLRQKAWGEIVVIGLILAVSLKAGFFAGVVVGFAVSSLLFVLNYSRVDVIRRQLTRRSFSSHVARSPADERRLREEGDSIHLYWLTGFLFFGSSHRLVGQIRRRIETQAPRPVRFVVLDFAATSGIDSAAVQSLAGLARFCSERNITVVCSSLDAATLRTLAGTQLLIAPQPPEGFTNHNDALAWCEDRLLGGEGGQGVERDFGAWVTREMGLPGRAVDLLAYFRQRTLAAGDALYQEGSPADTIDIIADGKVAIVVSVGGRRLEVRRMEQLTVVGEMGFFRNQTRSASVVAIEPVTVFTLDRADFERMQNADPLLARAILVFLIRTLSDRLEFANGAVRSLIDTAS